PSASPPVFRLSLHDALPISGLGVPARVKRRGHAVDALELAVGEVADVAVGRLEGTDEERRALTCDLFGRARVRRHADELVGVLTDRKSTRLNSSHQIISYAV